MTYEVLKPNWFVTSGRGKDGIFYVKTLFSHDQFKSFELTYNDSESAVYDPIVNRLSSCFSDLAR